MAVQPRTKKRVSRHKKAHWRKYTDIQDVEEALEQRRFEERTGGLVETRPNDILFFEDKKQPLTKLEKKKLGLNSFHQRKTPKTGGLKCYQLLQPAPFPKAVAVPKRGKKVKPRLPIRQAQETKKLNKWLEAARGTRPLRKRVLNEGVPQGWVPESDAWGDTKPPVVTQKASNLESEVNAPTVDEDDEFYTDVVDFYKQQTKQNLIKVPGVRYVKPSALPSVEVPQPGASYNPNFDDYQELVANATAVEIWKEKEEAHLNRVLVEKFPTKAEAPTQASWLQEMSQGLFKETIANESEDDSQDLVVGNAATICERKLRSRRRREKQQKAMSEMSKEEKLQRKRESDVYRIKKLKSEIKAAEALSDKRQAIRKARKEEKRFLPAKLSQHKYEAPDIEVQLSSELAGSLRCLKPEGCLLEDRLKSFQRRNIIEPRVRQNVKRKYRPKRYTRKSHKEQ